MITRHIHCTVEPEPASFHDHRTFSVNLGIEAEGTATPGGNDETEAKTWFEQALDFFGTLSFRLLRWNASTSSWVDAGERFRVPEPVEPDAVTGVIKWLDQSKASWLSPQAPSGETVDAETAPATYRLRAAQSWSAPIGHRHGLTHLVRLPADTLQEPHVILPWPTDAGAVPSLPGPPPVFKAGLPELAEDPLSFELDLPINETALRVTFHTRAIDTNVSAPTSDDVSPDGYLTVDKKAEIVWRMVDWLQTRSGSVFALSTALLDLARQDSAGSSTTGAAQTFADILRKTPKAASDPEKAAVVWFCATHLCAALDPLILGLHGPLVSADTASPGVLIAPLVNDLVDRLMAGLQPRPDPDTITEVIDLVRSRLKPVPPDPTVAGLFGWLKTAYPAQADTPILALLKFPDDPAKAFDTVFPDTSAETIGETIGETILRELNQIEQMLQDEGGAEEVLLRLLGDKFPGDLKDMLEFALKLVPASDEAIAKDKAVDEAWKAYLDLVKGPFNAAEAARRALSNEFARTAMEAARPTGSPVEDTPTRLSRVLQDADFFQQRLQDQPQGVFSGMIQVLPRLPPAQSAVLISALRTELQQAWTAPVGQIKALHASLSNPLTEPFTPDLAPAPLPIQIAASLSAEDALNFATDYNGIGVCIRRIDDPKAGIDVGWAHAHLARLDVPGDVPGVPAFSVPHAIATSYPAVSDGSGPMFLNYEGRPFTLPVVETAKKGAGPLYTADLPDGLDGFARIPELAYGRNFETFAFVTTNAGTLPKALQLSEGQPWLPNPTVTRPVEDFISQSSCQRRTAIGRAEIIESQTPGKARRLGAGFPGVHPLALDYPRPQGAREPDAPLLLLAPDGTKWQAALQGEVPFRLTAPRVTYRDFARWFANPDLFTSAFGTDDDGRMAGASLLDILWLIEQLRDIDPRIGPLVDRMPDPAVASLRLDLQQTDSLVDGPLQPIPQEWNVKDLLRTFARSKATAIGEIRQKIGTVTNDTGPVVDAILTGLLRPLDMHFSVDLRVSAGKWGLNPPTGEEQAFVAKVPPGNVARLSVDARVPAHLLKDVNSHPSAIHHGMTRFARPETEDDHYRFPSAAMQIETMLDGLQSLETVDQSTKTADQSDKTVKETLVDTMIALRPAIGARSYRIETRADVTTDHRQPWRLIGEIDVATRPSGRPLYHRIRPKDSWKKAHDLTNRPDATAALPLVKNDTVIAFETDAFLGRSPSDFLLSPPQRIAPLGGGTVLLEQPWTDASATCFRHRFILRSRYAGALKTANAREVKGWKTDDEKPQANEWSHRVAMRAELPALELTRPQLSALIPLTTAPSDADPVPPVMAVLQERPFDRGGLADLVLAEIRTGFGFGFQGTGNTLSLVDSRKEIGPDPRITYLPVPSDQATGLALSVEGVAGLTFDPEGASAPAFPNAMMLLSPVSMRKDAPDLTEHHLGVQLWRTLDPGWVFPATTENGGSLSPSETWWIEVDGNQEGVILGVSAPPGNPSGTGADQTRSVLVVAAGEGGDLRRLLLNPQIVDPVGAKAGATAADPIPVASWNPSLLTGPLVILHRPAAAGRCLTSVLGRMQSAVRGIGEGTSTVVLASFEWSVNAGEMLVPGQDTSEGLEVDPPVRTSASGATALAWTRTSRDADKVDILVENDGSHGVERIAIADVAGLLSGTALSFRRTGHPDAPSPIVPSLLTSSFPLHVQRHLAVLLTSQFAGSGRPVETFHNAAVLFGPSVGLQDTDVAKVRRNPLARIIEFETPAVILCAGRTDTIPETYRTAYLDLLSHRPEAPGKDWQLRFLLRFNTPQPLAAEGHSLTLKASSPKGDRVGKLDLSLALAANGAAAKVRAVEITVTMVQGSIGPPVTRFLGDDGAVTLPVLNAQDMADASNDDGLNVSLSLTGDPDVWADLSALWSWRGPKGGAFDFDWLFGPPSDPSANPEREIGPAALATLREAQARIISTSPPIPVNRTP